jgi:hypothetical protein
MATKLYSSEEIDDLWQRAESIIGSQQFQDLVRAHRESSPRSRHRLIDQLIAVDEARQGLLSAIREDAAVVALPEIDSVLSFAEEARATAAHTSWREIHRGLIAEAEYLHSVGVLQVASLLRVHHPATQFVSTPAGGGREPDLQLMVTDGLPLAVEVKARDKFWQPSQKLTLSEGRHEIRNALASAGTVQGQLRADRPGVLVLTGLLMSQETYDTVVVSMEHHLSADGARAPHLLGLAVANLRSRVEVESGRVLPLLEQQSVLRRNPNYTGRLQIDDDWAQQWRLVES